MAALGIEEKGAVVVTAAEGWHAGVVGLVAARLKAPSERSTQQIEVVRSDKPDPELCRILMTEGIRRQRLGLATCVPAPEGFRQFVHGAGQQY
jgi:single-stranded DNA-specific DHH superfamily exonuclease